MLKGEVKYLSMDLPMLSIVIPALNEEKYLPFLLQVEILPRQTYADVGNYLSRLPRTRQSR